MKSKLSTAKKPKTTTFSRVFQPKKIDNFVGKSKLNFWTKNEDFEQCARAAHLLLVFFITGDFSLGYFAKLGDNRAKILDAL